MGTTADENLPKLSHLSGVSQDKQRVELDIDLFDTINGNFEFTGDGFLVFPNGNRYEGSFKAGKYHGLGKLVLGGDGFVTHEGQFENGHLIYGTFRNPDGSGEIYEGEWEKDGFGTSQTGRGKKTHFNLTATGEWIKNVTECDTFVNGIPDGFTKETIEQGDIQFVTQSYYKNGNPEGVVKYFTPDGQLIGEAYYKNGKRI